MLVEALTALTTLVTALVATLLLLLLEGVVDLLDVHVVEPSIKQADLLAPDLGHGHHGTGWVALNDG